MEPDGSLPYSQELTACSTLSQINSIRSLSSYFFKSHVNIMQYFLIFTKCMSRFPN
jgi:hypothetical protein